MNEVMTREVLTKDYGIKNLTSPTGRKFKVVAFPKNPSLYMIAYADEKGGSLPPEFLKCNLFTRKSIAEEQLDKYLRDFWEMSDKKKVA